MTGWRKRQVVEHMWKVASNNPNHDTNWHDPIVEHFAELVRADEREQIAQMIEDAPALVEFVQNDKGGCAICGFTPKLAAESIRARGQA